MRDRGVEEQTSFVCPIIRNSTVALAQDTENNTFTLKSMERNTTIQSMGDMTPTCHVLYAMPLLKQSS